MQIPARLARLLKKDRPLETAVNASLDELLPWLEAGGTRPTFFPDYTDHSVRHIQDVLETAVSLIRDEAWAVFTAVDAAVMVLATLLHDSAMHLTHEGFEALVRSGTRWTPLDGFDDPPWPQLWADFCLEARRFDQRKLTDLFGDPEPVQIPNLDDLKLDDKGRRLIGEFIRRHHPRLAHEIARHGVPGSTDEPLRLRAGEKIADLAGLVARSHGLSARACLPYLKAKHHSRVDPYGVHAVFLIALLRVADYLQIQPGRAPERMLKVHRIHSPYSVVEWKVHASVTQISESDDDPEAVRIVAEPAEVNSYLRLKEWLTGLQSEIDASWAVLGEVFSRQQTKKLDRLGIKLRRVLSNLDDDATFTKTVGYLPRHVAFTTAGADLLKLLIQPLYGDRPEIGVRELVQNAVDAVRELDSLRERGFVPNGLDLVEQEADVVVMLEEIEDDWWLTVSDRGIGMSSEVICGYFLRAGASFRRSEAWQRQFGEKGRPLVLRTGRFGIGALAAFLLGQEIHVSTRHVSESSGLAFLAGIDTDPIEVRQVQSPVGTTVRVRLFPEIAKSLVNTRVQRSPAFMELEERLRWSRKIDRGNDTWDWYCLATPSVARKIKPDGVLIPQRYMLPGPGETLPPHWRRLADTEFEDVHWSYAEAPPLTCNGIVVLTDPPSLGLDTVAGMKFRMPAVSVFDRDGGLALTLQRTGLTTNRYPFEKRLVTDVINDYVAFSLATAPDAPVTMTGDPAWYLGGQYTGCHSLGDGVGMWGSCEGGIVPIQGAITSCLELRSVLILPLLSSIGRGRFYIPRIRTRTDSAIVIVESTVHQGVTRFHETAPKDSFIKSYRMVFDLFLKTMLGFETEMEERLGQEVLGIRFTIPVDFLPEFSRLSELQSLVNHFVYEHAGGQAIWSTGECAAMDKFIPVIDQFDRVGRKPFGVAVEFYLGPATKRVSDDLFSRVWNSVVGNPIIPYDRAERKRMLASAFRKLTPYMEANAHQEPSGGA